MTLLGDHIRQHRLQRHLTLGQLARFIGYKNLDKGSRRLRTLEETGEVDAELLTNVATGLDLDPAVINH